MLPTQKTKVIKSLSSYRILIYGDPKVGKTTFVAGFPNVLFFATEEGQNALEIFKVPINNWDDFLQACADLAAGGHEYKNVAIDTIDLLYDYCFDWVCKKNGITHPSELDYGKGWDAVKNEFKRAILKLSQLPYGLIFISHTRQEKINSRTGEFIKTVPSLKANPSEFMIGICDFILYFTIDQTGDDELRLIKTTPSKYHIAGARIALPEVLPLSLEAFGRAFGASIKSLIKPAAKAETEQPQTEKE